MATPGINPRSLLLLIPITRGGRAYSKEIATIDLVEAGLIPAASDSPEPGMSDHSPTLEEAKAALALAWPYVPEAVEKAATYYDELKALWAAINAVVAEIGDQPLDRNTYEVLCQQYGVETEDDVWIHRAGTGYGSNGAVDRDINTAMRVHLVRHRAKHIKNILDTYPLAIPITGVRAPALEGENGELYLIKLLLVNPLEDLVPYYEVADGFDGVFGVNYEQVPLKWVASTYTKVVKMVTDYMDAHHPEMPISLTPADPGYTFTTWLPKQFFATDIPRFDSVSNIRRLISYAAEERVTEQNTDADGVERRPCYSCGRRFRVEEVVAQGGDWAGNPFEAGTCYCGC